MRDGIDQWLSSAPNKRNGRRTLFFLESTTTCKRRRSQRERCSRPLWSSQHTIGTPPTSRHTIHQPARVRGPPSPTVPGRRHRSLRTQQRARPRTSQTPNVPNHRSGRTGCGAGVPATNRRCSTLELTTAEHVSAKWLWQRPLRATADAP